MGRYLDLIDRLVARAVAPAIIQAEARREAIRIHNRLRSTVERIEQRRGREMARMVLLYLQELESNNSAAHSLGD